MRFISWNIQHGGGRRAANIAAQILEWSPDVVGLMEFRETPGSQLIADSLACHGLQHQIKATDAQQANRNSVFLASRFPLEARRCDGILRSTGCWIHALMDGSIPIDVTVMHVPNRETGMKYDFHDKVIGELAQRGDHFGLAFGDTNSGQALLDEDTRFFNKRETRWFDELRAVGWYDVWRVRNGENKEFTWHSNQGSEFRLDQVFATKRLEPFVSWVRHEWVEQDGKKLSDHAAIVFELDTNSARANQGTERSQ